MNLRSIFKLLVVLFLIGVIFIIYCYLETYWIREKEIILESPQIPESFNNRKVIFISDIHHGPYLKLKRVSKLVQKINNIEPDIVILGGDYVHREPIYIKPVFQELSKIKSKYGIYGVLGNHDHWEDPDLTRECMKKSKIKICDNKSYWIKIDSDSIKIGGVGDLWEDSQLPENTLFDVKEENYCILISHNPDFLENWVDKNVDLTLSGHTHGGQVTLFGLWAPLLSTKFGQKYRYGLIQKENTISYITSGIGTITPPLRFFCRPEIVIFELRKSRHTK